MKLLRQVPKILFGAGAFDSLGEAVSTLKNSGYAVYIIDAVHAKTGLVNKLPLVGNDYSLSVDTTDEPTTDGVDALRDEIKKRSDKLPAVIVGVGGGSTLDIAKAVSVVLTNPGSSRDYQGWELVKNAPIPKVGVQTLSGTGSEATRTAVLTSPGKKFGINSPYSLFDLVVLDPLLARTVPAEQQFYTGMDCYIHCVESINGSFKDKLITVYVQAGLAMCRDIFLKGGEPSDQDRENLMIASYFGGLSIANSEVGVCHALSYGLSLELKFHHGLANCIAFNQLEEYYPNEVSDFKEMLERNNIVLPKNVTQAVSAEQMESMIAMTLLMEKPLTNALGPDWKNVFPREKILQLYARM